MSPRRRRHSPPPTVPLVGPEVKQTTESFSYVEDPTLRFVAALSAGPETPSSVVPPTEQVDAIVELGPTTALPAMSAAPGVVPPLAMASTLAASTTAAPPAAPAPAEAPTIANGASGSRERRTSESDGRASSRGRRRLTASLGSLLSGKKDKHRIEEHAASSASASSVALEGADAQHDAAGGSSAARSRRSSSASRRPGLGGSAIADSSSSIPTPSVAPAHDRSHKPPVTLPHIFRRRHSGSRISPAPSSSSPSPALAASTSSSAAVDATRSSLDAGSELRHVPRDHVQPLQPAASDSNGSLAAWTVTGSSTSTAPTSPDTLASAPEDDGPTTTTAEKRRRSSLALAHELGGDGRNEVAEDLADFVSASNGTAASPTSSTTTARGLHDEEEQEADDDDSDTDTDADEASEDEGDHYATSDEGPVTTRSPIATPAQTPGLGAHVTPRARTPGTPSRYSSLTPLTIPGGPSGAAGSANWVSFAPKTPTPSTARTARVQAAGISYFDLPRPSTSAARTPGLGSAAPKTPLAPMSMSEIARGKRPTLQEDVDAGVAGPAVAAGPATAEASDRSASGHDAGLGVSTGSRAGLYRLRSQSVVALASPSMVDQDDEPVGTAAIQGLDPVWQTGVAKGQKTPAPSFLSFGQAAQQQQPSAPQTPGVPGGLRTPGGLKTPAPLDTSLPVAASPSASPTARSRPTTASPGNRLQRTRSMYELRDAPPAYNAFYRSAGTGPAQIIYPREEEGIEGLPPYSCAIHIEGFMPRKMEFTAPGVQARDRAWRRQYFVLHGTAIKIYRFDLRTHPIPGEDDWSRVRADQIAGSAPGGPAPLHFHEGEYGVDASAPARKFPLSVTDAKAKAKDRIITSATASAQNSLVRHYSLQNAESGLAADYIKRKHVVRVRAEGEQFLLQAKDDRGVIDLIEALQAATNVALDLDARPLPKFITLPRRRRRRRRVVADPNAAASTAAPGTENGAGANGAAAAPAAGGGGGGNNDRMADMLAEEQNAYSQRASGTVM
ncbi:hypothetical protein Rhopal_002282-T1 [Rhodotorula paludigena]|uniref:PH domain-containing protein n=1 Tax=Rhodotorula paludigena TaxID=86838 RepID=A0AAV5GJS9_9BASI|nr:hypothetical protein Rhopal_002282-T1 [Rhodotorula paludigena]